MPRYDIHFQALTEQEQRDTFKFVGFGFSPTIAVRGFQMLINHWIKCLLTPRGSDPTNLTYGTDFTKLIGSNLPLSDARDVCTLAVDLCNEQINDFQVSDTTLTATERLASAEVTNLIQDPSAPGFSVYVEIKNQANERLVLNIPVSAVAE